MQIEPISLETEAKSPDIGEKSCRARQSARNCLKPTGGDVTRSDSVVITDYPLVAFLLSCLSGSHSKNLPPSQKGHSLVNGSRAVTTINLSLSWCKIEDGKFSLSSSFFIDLLLSLYIVMSGPARAEYFWATFSPLQASIVFLQGFF